MRFAALISSRFFRVGLLLALSLAAYSRPALAEPVIVVEGVNILNGKHAEAVFYYQNNWAHFRREAERQDSIDSYEMIVADADSDEPVDILLITRFVDAAQYADIEDAYERIAGSRELQLLNDVSPGDFRQNVFVVIQGDAQAAE